MKNTTRALRRHHNVRVLNRTIRKLTQREDNPDHLMWRARRMYNNMAVCSCSMCRNVRSSGWLSATERLTLAERRNLESFNDQVKEVDLLGDIVYNISLCQNENQ